MLARHRLLDRVMQVLRCLSILTAAATSQFVLASECDDLSGDDRTVCLTLVVCTSLQDEKARNQCLTIARQLLGEGESSDGSEEKQRIEEAAAIRGQPSKDTAMRVSTTKW